MEIYQVEHKIKQLKQKVADLERECANNNNDNERLYGVAVDLEKEIDILEQEIKHIKNNNVVNNNDICAMLDKIYNLKLKLSDIKSKLKTKNKPRR